MKLLLVEFHKLRSSRYLEQWSYMLSSLPKETYTVLKHLVTALISWPVSNPVSAQSGHVKQVIKHDLMQGCSRELPEQLDDANGLVSENAKVGTFIAALYENKWNIGWIEKVDQSDETVHISFMAKANTKLSRKFFQWPRRDDKLWLGLDDVLCTITEPLPTGKSQR